MKKETVVAGFGVHTARITRARAAACHANGVMLPLLPPLTKPDKKRMQQKALKRAALDENNHASTHTASFQSKRRAVLKDVTNICCENSYKDCTNAARKQVSQLAKLGPSKSKLSVDSKGPTLVPAFSVGSELVQDEAKNKMAEVVQKVGMWESQESTISLIVEKSLLVPQKMEGVTNRESTGHTVLYTEHSYKEELKDHLTNVKDKLCMDSGGLTGVDFIDIDSDYANPQMCSLYAPEIYTNLRVAELIRRPCYNFLETLQRDITQGMRGILIDWLVEVSEEYMLELDTLYLTVYIIDQFLSHNLIERKRLQLVGITCMLIASKYQEICAPRAEEFCFITDNTYTKEEVLNMESQVLNYLGFHLSVPTIKTFLRRFLRAAEASYKVCSLILGYLANYLAELTLVEYSFLKFLPSLIAASAVFLARWTLDQSDHPWNLTLEHYSSYKASDLKAAVFALQDLQMNSKDSRLNAIYHKYKQQKFESVADLTSPKLLQSLFC